MHNVKEKRLFEKGLNKIAKMQILSQNELKNYEKMTNEELIISILKSKQSIAELFNNNNSLYDNKISNIRRIT